MALRISPMMLVLCVSLIGTVRADDLSEAEAKLLKARGNHADAIAEVREEVAKQIRDKVAEEKKRTNSDLNKLESFQAQLQDLEKGIFPKWIGAKEKRKIADADRKLIASLGQMKQAYIRADDFTRARTIEKEIEEVTIGSVKGAGAASTAIFNGKDLTGWRGLSGLWIVKDGVITGSTRPDGINFNTCLCSDREYGDFELTCKVKLTGSAAANSGIQVRSKIIDTNKFVVRGPQCDIGQTYWGSLYAEGGGMLREANKELVRTALKPDGFNELWVRCVGQRVSIKINGQMTVDDEFPTIPSRGIVGWQLHAGKAIEVFIKDIEFKPLTPTR